MSSSDSENSDNSEAQNNDEINKKPNGAAKHNIITFTVKLSNLTESKQPEGDVYSTALNMVHLPTEVASINEMGEALDSLDDLRCAGELKR